MIYSDNLAPSINIDDFVSAIRHGDATSTLTKEVVALEVLVRTMGKLLTPAQIEQLANCDEVKGLLTQDNTPSAGNGYCGSSGGFGTEELEQWQRMIHWPTP